MFSSSSSSSFLSSLSPVSPVSRVSRVHLMHFIMRFTFYVFQFFLIDYVLYEYRSQLKNLIRYLLGRVVCVCVCVSIPLADSDLWHFSFFTRFFFFRRNRFVIRIWNFNLNLLFVRQATRQATNHNNNSILYFRFFNCAYDYSRQTSIGNCSNERKKKKK